MLRKINSGTCTYLYLNNQNENCKRNVRTLVSDRTKEREECNTLKIRPYIILFMNSRTALIFTINLMEKKSYYKLFLFKIPEQFQKHSQLTNTTLYYYYRYLSQHIILSEAESRRTLRACKRIIRMALIMITKLIYYVHHQ